MNIPVNKSEILLTKPFLFYVPVVIYRMLTELQLCICLFACFQCDAQVLPDQTDLESAVVVSASRHIFEHARPWVVCVNAPRPTCAHREDARKDFGIDS